MTQDARFAPGLSDQPPSHPGLARGARLATSRVRPNLMLAMVMLLAGGCATLGGDRGQPLVPTKYETRTGPFAIFTGTPIAPDAPAVRNLRSLERDLATNLGLRVSPDGAPVEVYILRDRDTFTHFLKYYYPELPPRRAFFLAQGPRRVIYTYQNDRLDEDLRHEGTHSLLHLAVGDLPLWLDEGLAEYFEGPEGRNGLNPEHLARLPDDLKTGWKPDLARLETLKSVRDMTPRDYRESWAWVHYLLNDSDAGKAALLSELADLSAQPKSAPPLSYKLGGGERSSAIGRLMVSHLDDVRKGPGPATVAVAIPPLDPAVHLQNSPVTAPRRSLLGRFMSMIGLNGARNGE